MLAHSLPTNPSRATRCPVTSRVPSAPLGLVSSLGFNRVCKEKVKLFINVDRYTKYSSPFCYTQQSSRITPLASASFGGSADSSTSIFPRIHVKDPYRRLGISREASEEEIRAARNFLISKYAGHKPSVDAIESAHDRIIMQSFFDRKKPTMNLKKKFRELGQSRAIKAIQGRFQTPSSRVIWQTAITFVFLGVLTLVFPTEEGPTLQVAISCAANIYFLNQRLRSGWKAFFYGFGTFFASWLLGTFLMVSVIPPILPGPRNLELFRLCLPDIIRCKIAFWKKANLIFLFFLLRKLILPFYSFTLFCIILPMTMFVPEAELPDWVVCYIPALMSFLNILPAPKSFPFIIPYLLFENTMSVTKFNAMISGLFQLGSAYEWVVTKKSGRSSEGDLIALAPKGLKQQKAGSTPILDAAAMEEQSMPKQPASRKEARKKYNRIYKKELALSLLLLTAAARSLLSKQGIHFYFLLFQGLAFLLVGLDLIGEDVK